MADIFREVDEDLRRERYEKLWKRYGRYVIAVAVAIVLGVAAQQAWRQYDLGRREAAGKLFAQALVLANEGRSADAANAFADLAADTGTGYATLARLQEAALKAKGGDDSGAVTIYESIAADSGTDRIFRDLAVILLVLHDFDTADPAVLGDRLAPLTVEDNPWHYSARELTALLALRTGDEPRARELLTGLTDDSAAPPGLRARAAEVLATLDR